MIYDEIRVLDRTVGLPGAYAAKLLTDLGADVVRVEPVGGDPMRVDGLDGLHFEYLRTSQRCVADGAGWEPGAHVVLRNEPGRSDALVTVTISALGFGGPDDGLNSLGLSEPLLQARSGAAMGHGNMSDVPLTVAGNLGSYCAGVFAALGAATSLRRALRTGISEQLDVSQLEAMQLTMLTMPTLFANFPGGAKHAFRFVMIPGNEPCGDGNYVGITTNTAAQWRALCAAMGRDDLLEDASLSTMIGRFGQADLVNGAIRAWTGRHTAAEIEDQCEAVRVPVAIVGNGKLLLEFAHLRERGVWVAQPARDVIRPRAPFRFGAVADRALGPAPGPPMDEIAWPPRRHPHSGTADSNRGSESLPLAGIRVLDFTAFWAGPSAVAWLAAMGADVIKVESMQRPDGMRMAGPVKSDAGPIYELSPLFHASNLNKRGITLDLTRPEGVAIAKRLAATVDVVCENFTPHVMEQFGLTYDELTSGELTSGDGNGARSDLIMLRLPAFGLTGPWRDRPGFAQTMEQLTGIAWTTGYEGGPPIIAGGVVDPMVGAHAALALVAAIAHRDATGEGQLVEVPMVEVALATTAEQVLRFQHSGELGERRGAHGVYRCEGHEAWIAIDESQDPMANAARAQWCSTRSSSDAYDELLAAEIPAQVVAAGYAALDDAQMQARGYFEPVVHAVVGEQQFPGWPIRFSAGPQRYWRTAAPCLGEHNREVLIDGLGLTEAEFDDLVAAGIVGTTPL